MAANRTNDDLGVTIADMEKEHALALQRLMHQHAQTVKSLRLENKELSEQVEETHKERNNIRKELKVASNYIHELEERAYNANKTSLNLLRQVRDLEVETQALKNYIIDLKARVAVYVPVKGDQIDQ